MERPVFTDLELAAIAMIVLIFRNRAGLAGHKFHQETEEVMESIRNKVMPYLEDAND